MGDSNVVTTDTVVWIEIGGGGDPGAMKDSHH